MKTIVHITADYPDHYDQKKTVAVKLLLEMVTGYKHIVYSLNRRNGLSGVNLIEQDDELTTLTYKAPPMGLLLKSGLKPAARWIANDLKKRNIKPSAIHAHKFTIDGIVATEIAEQTGAPLITNIWGDTDQKLIRYKPELKSTFKKTVAQSSKILAATPWARDYVQSQLGGPDNKYQILPVVTDIDNFTPSALSDKGLVTVLKLDSYKRKNTLRLIEAIKQLSATRKDIKLTIIGGGSNEAMERVRAAINAANMQQHIDLAGPVPQQQVQSTINQYSALILPSLRDTFGMVFVEALFAGIPILHARNQALDGYFDHLDVGRTCDPKSVPDIARKIDEILDQEERLKNNISAAHNNGEFNKFLKTDIAKEYENVLDKLTSSADQTATASSVI